jgi:hypothetical protein
MKEKLYDIIDKYGYVMPRHYSGRARTKAEAVKLVERLNKDGECKPYKMIEAK